MRSAAMRRYRLFGLLVESELALPELPLAEGQEVVGADLTIRLGAGEAARAGYRLSIPNVARFTIADGREIVVEPEKGAHERELRLFLLGSAMGAALHQRGILPLHANAIAIDGQAIAFMGRSGAGKSTLAAWFHDEGFPVLADDVCVIRLEDGVPHAYPGLLRLRLWQDALVASGRSPTDHPPSFHVRGDDRRKFDVALAPDAVSQSPLPLGALILLEEGPDAAIEPLAGSRAVEAISANTYRGRLIAELGNSNAHLAACVAIVRAVPVLTFKRPFDRSGFEAQCRDILAYCRSILPSG